MKPGVPRRPWSGQQRPGELRRALAEKRSQESSKGLGGQVPIGKVPGHSLSGPPIKALGGSVPIGKVLGNSLSGPPIKAAGG